MELLPCSADYVTLLLDTHAFGLKMMDTVACLIVHVSLSSLLDMHLKTQCMNLQPVTVLVSQKFVGKQCKYIII